MDARNTRDTAQTLPPKAIGAAAWGDARRGSSQPGWRAAHAAGLRAACGLLPAQQALNVLFPFNPLS